ncbi:hypothetical protein LX36DRAFT_742245 [Colletotrichum falcatum]|nr:hypothetical protein LX36DRAFT_742245 [Colletotrichum falcatum]
MAVGDEVMLSDKLEAVDGPESVVSVGDSVASIELVDRAEDDCEEVAIESVEEILIDEAVDGCEEEAVESVEEADNSIELLLDSAEDDDSEEEETSPGAEDAMEVVGTEPVDSEANDESSDGSKLVKPEEEIRTEELLVSAEDCDSEEDKISCAFGVGVEIIGVEVIEPEVNDEPSDGSKPGESDEGSDNDSVGELDGVKGADKSDDKDEIGVSDETVDSNELEVASEVEKSVDVDDSAELEIELSENVGVPEDASDNVTPGELEAANPSSGGPIELAGIEDSGVSVEIKEEASNKAEELDGLNDADKSEELRISVEEELDSAEIAKEVDGNDKLVLEETLEESDDVGEVEELEDSSTLAKDWCATMTVPGRPPDGRTVEIGSGAVRTSVPEYSTVDVTKRPGCAKTTVPGAVPLGCIVVMGIVSVTILVPE